MKDLFKFKGDQDESRYEYGKIYMLDIRDNYFAKKVASNVIIMLPLWNAYDSWEEFFKEWERV